MTVPYDFSMQDLSDTIGVIYDCSLDPQRWPGAIQRIVSLSDSTAGAVCVHHLRSTQNDHAFEFGYKPGFTTLFERRYAESPMAAATPLGTVGQVATIGMLVDEKEILESRFYHEVIKPFGYLDYIGTVALRTKDRIASLHACRLQHDPRYGHRELQLFNLLSPHICRALTISDALDIKTLQSEMLEETLDGLTTAVYLTARDGRVVYLNSAAERQIKTGNALRIVNNRLVPNNPQARAELAKKVEEIANDESSAGPPGHSLAIPDSDGVGFVATFLPLERGSRQACARPFAAAAAIFVQDPAVVPLFPGEAFARLYGLSPGELRVALAMAPGLTPAEAADILGIGLQTVKTHLQHIFQKTGTNRQVDLIALMQRSSCPVSSG